MKGAEESFAASWQKLWPHGRRECIRRKESWCPRTRSKAVSLLGQLRSSGNLEALFAEHFTLAGEKIGHFGRLLGFGGQQAGDYTPALGDMDFFAFAEEFFHFREAVAEVADGGFLHVIHFSITLEGGQSTILPRAGPALSPGYVCGAAEAMPRLTPGGASPAPTRDWEHQGIGQAGVRIRWER